MKYNTIEILVRVVLLVSKIAPISGFLALFYKSFEGLFPAYVTGISMLLFDAVSQYLAKTGDIYWVQVYGVWLLLGYLFKQLMLYMGAIAVNAGVYEKVSKNSAFYLYEKCARLPLISYEDSSMLDHKERAISCVNREMIAQLYMTNMQMIISAVGVVSIIAILARSSWVFIPISLLSVIPYFIVQMIRGQQFYALSLRQVKQERKKNYLWSLFSNKQVVKEMRVMNFSHYLMDQWQKVRDDVNEESWQLMKKDAKSLLVCDLIRLIGYTTSLFLAMILMFNGTISLAILGATIVAFASVQSQTQAFLMELGKLPERINYARDYFTFLDQPSEVVGDEELVNSFKKINLESITFRYPHVASNALQDLHLSITAGQTIALVGENGSGKTTLTKVLMGLYQPSHGVVKVNDEVLTLANRSHFLSHVSIIAQHFVAYQLSLRENVTISHLSAQFDDEAINRALVAANFSLTDLTLDSMLGREFDGNELSGGQWQKLAIARGNFKTAPLIIMDEPTSALDPLAEMEILQQFLAIIQDKTAIIVSHRIGLCRLVDSIAVMKAGQIVEFGSHQELLQLKGEYAKLYQTQSQWYL